MERWPRFGLSVEIASIQPAADGDAQRAFNVLHMPPYQVDAVNCGNRFTWNNWSRQTGKSFAFALRRILRGLARRRTQVFLSASQRQSRELMEKVRAHCAMLKISFELFESECFANSAIRKLEAHLPGKVRIIALPANPMTARGFSGDVFLDEFAMHRDDREIWSALFPSLLRGRGELDIASTPRGRANLFYSLRANERFAHSTVTIHQAVAMGLVADISALRGTIHDPVAWRQEFECEFVDEATAFMPHELITRCQDVVLRKELDESRLVDAAARLYVGVDVARVHDLTVIWVWEVIPGPRFVTRGVLEMDRASFAQQRRTIESLLQRATVRRVAIDCTGLGAQLAEELVTAFGAHRVEPVHFTSETKSDLAGRLRVSAERGELAIPEDDAIRQDWHSIEQVMTTAGHVRYRADRGRGGHADRFWAAALGLHAARQPDGRVEYCGDDGLRFARRGAW